MQSTFVLFRQFVNQAFKATISFSPYLQEVITGMLLGDGCISKISLTGLARLMVQQKNQEFILFLWNLFKSIGCVGAVPYLRSQLDKRTGNTYVSYAFSTFSLAFLLFFSNNGIPLLMGKLLNIYPQTSRIC